MLILKKFYHCSEEEQDLILAWRNHPDVRTNMVYSDLISREEHLKFIRKLKDRDDVDYRLVQENNEYIGVIDLIHIQNNQAELGLYKNPELNRKGIGQLLMKGLFAISKQWHIKKLLLKVKKSNFTAISLYSKFDFSISSEDSEYKFMEKILIKNTFIVAELSANHGHDLKLAKKSILAIAETGVDAIKIQTYTADTITIDCNNKYFQIDKGTMWDGRTLYNLYQEAYTPWEWHEELKDYAESLGLVFFSSPFDKTAVDYLEKMNNPIYKIASFEITDIPLIEYVASKLKPMIISTGIATIGEIQEAVDACHNKGNYNITLLKCTSSYPAPTNEANLRTMVNMKETFGVKVGLSDHTLGGDVAIAAVALGAEIVEKHFILDRSIGGPDASFSMLPDDFKKMVKSIRNVEKALGTINYNLTEKQQASRKFSRSLFVVKDIKKGEIFNDENIKSIRPGDGISPKYLEEILGKTAKTDYKRGSPVTNLFYDAKRCL